jgi:hypothetical protein
MEYKVGDKSLTVNLPSFTPTINCSYCNLVTDLLYNNRTILSSFV